MKKIEELDKEVRLNRKAFKKKLDKLRSMKDGKLDAMIHQYDEEAFEQMDCMTCANCCKTLGPLLTQKDVHRIAKHLRIKPGAFMDKYVRIDEDNDYVFKTMPCVFLSEDNSCSIYDVKPKACKDYPNTHLRHQKIILPLMLKNAEYCPPVLDILEKL